jgi:PhnB protein
MQLNPYLNFNGQCEAAFKFYEKHLHGKIEMMMAHKDSPMAAPTPPVMRDKIMHARMSIGGTVLMGSDAPLSGFEGIKGFSVSLTLDTPAEAEQIFKALAEKGSVRMPLEKTFWAARFGMLIDQFGVPWMINCEQG